MSQKNRNYFILQSKEEEVMKVLWNTDEALSATEIAEAIPNRSWPSESIQNIIRSLEKKDAIYIYKITKLGKSYGRLFRPVLTANEYAAMQFERFYQRQNDNKFSVLSSLLELSGEGKEAILEILLKQREEK